MATLDDGEVEYSDDRVRAQAPWAHGTWHVAVETRGRRLVGERRVVFMSYAHADADIVERISLVLKPLVREGHVDIWADERIAVGRRWNDEIEAALRRADIALLLVSSDFLASDYIMRVELPRLIQRAVPLVCVPVSECAWWDLDQIATVQWPLPPERPLRSMRRAQRESALVRVYEAVKELLSPLDPVPQDQALPASGPPSDTHGGKRSYAVLPPPESAPRPKPVKRFGIARRPRAVVLAVALVVLLSAAIFALTRGENREPQTVANGRTITSSSVGVTSSSTPDETSSTGLATSTDSRSRRVAGSDATQGAAPPPSTAPANSDPDSNPLPSPSPPAESPQPGQWTARPPGLENHCMATQQAGPNLWYQICWSGATPMMVVTVSGITGQSRNHEVAVPRVWTVVNGVHSRGTSCPLKTVTIGQSFVCIDQTGPSAPGMNVESSGRLLHDGVESVLFTPRV